MPTFVVNTPTVLLFLKAPREGQVKTRLAKTIGTKDALAAYCKMATKQVEEIDPKWNKRIHYTPTDALSEMRNWLGCDRVYVAQNDGDLGTRLSTAVEQHFQNHAGPVFLIGADCPWLDSHVLQNAAKAISKSDIVIGPAHDGGYYLLGLNQSTPSLFEGIEWSTKKVFNQTIEQAKAANLSIVELSPLHDVDTIEEWTHAQQAFPELVTLNAKLAAT